VTDARWAELYDHAVRRFGGQAPRPLDEEAILEHFTANPVLVAKMVEEIADAMDAGKPIRWGWSTLRGRLERARPSRDVVVTDGRKREPAVAAAERWLRVAGCMFDREDEILHALFGPGGDLHEWAKIELENVSGADEKPRWQSTQIVGDRELVERMISVWKQHRPRGEKCEADEQIRAEKFRADRALVARRKRLLEVAPA
jgi:hypothetical protein